MHPFHCADACSSAFPVSWRRDVWSSDEHYLRRASRIKSIKFVRKALDVFCWCAFVSETHAGIRVRLCPKYSCDELQWGTCGPSHYVWILAVSVSLKSPAYCWAQQTMTKAHSGPRLLVSFGLSLFRDAGVLSVSGLQFQNPITHGLKMPNDACRESRTQKSNYSRSIAHFCWNEHCYWQHAWSETSLQLTDSRWIDVPTYPALLPSWFNAFCTFLRNGKGNPTIFLESVAYSWFEHEVFFVLHSLWIFPDPQWERWS